MSGQYEHISRDQLNPSLFITLTHILKVFLCLQCYQPMSLQSRSCTKVTLFVISQLCWCARASDIKTMWNQLHSQCCWSLLPPGEAGQEYPLPHQQRGPSQDSDYWSWAAHQSDRGEWAKSCCGHSKILFSLHPRTFYRTSSEFYFQVFHLLLHFMYLFLFYCHELFLSFFLSALLVFNPI